MTLRTIPATMVATLCLLAAPSLLAAPFNRSTPATVHAAKLHMVAFQVRNSSADVMTVQAGEKQITLQRGETVNVKLPVGQPLTSQTTTAHYQAGALLATACKELGGNTLVLN